MVTTTGLHAIRALAYLALQPKGTKMGAAAIAQEIKAPQNYLGKLLQTLANEGLLESQKGHGGGFSLARVPKKISLYDVLDPIERLSDRPECFFGWKKCSDKHPCAMHEKWTPRRDAFYELLKSTTIDEVTTGEIFEP
jgi:Rrf2 family protein